MQTQEDTAELIGTENESDHSRAGVSSLWVPREGLGGGSVSVKRHLNFSKVNLSVT